MRALRIIVVLVVILGGLFVIADRVAVHFAEGEVADRVKARENLPSTPDVDIKGFPFLTQVAGGTLDEVDLGIRSYPVPTGTKDGTIRIDDLEADLRDVKFSGDYSSATAASGTGSATIAYDQLMKAAKTEPAELAPGVTAQVTGLGNGGDGKIKLSVKVGVPALGINPTISVLSSVDVKGGKVSLHADALPAIAGANLADGALRKVTDFQQALDQLPGGIALDRVRATPDGLRITVKGTDLKLAG
ncbi:LmeA family phospholipid-binding protein [Streptomyces sp. NPDC059597]|uniref:LmeA family phospholipid-binding protein n=1 Tax=Streptomyces sp. NPDC059597 TaxID=3346879 RepID=UPI0036968B1F